MEIQVMEFEVKELIPAKVISNEGDLRLYIEAVKEKYEGWIVTEDVIEKAKATRTALNKLRDKVSDERKRIQREANRNIDELISNMKGYENEINTLSSFIGEQLKIYDDKAREEKRAEIIKKINGTFTALPDLKEFLVFDEKWLNKTTKMKQVENDISVQFEEIEKKYRFILAELNKANKEIEFKIVFEAARSLMTREYEDISKAIEARKNEIKTTEENLRQKAKERAEREAEEKIRKAQEENIGQQAEATETADDDKPETPAVKGKKSDIYIIIKVSGLSKEATNELKNVLVKHDIKYTKEMR